MDLAGYRPKLNEVSALFGKSSRWVSDLRAKGEMPEDGATLSASRRCTISRCMGRRLGYMGVAFFEPTTPADTTTYGHAIRDSSFELVAGNSFLSFSGINYQPMDVDVVDTTFIAVAQTLTMISGYGYNLRARNIRLDLYNWAGLASTYMTLINGATTIQGAIDLDGLEVTRSYSPTAIAIAAVSLPTVNLPNMRVRIANIEYVDNNTGDGLPPRDWVPSSALNPFAIQGNMPFACVSGVKRLDAGNIATAAATVNVASGDILSINQVADNEIFVTLTSAAGSAIGLGDLPVANRLPGDKVYLFNISSIVITIDNVPIAAGSAARFVLLGNGWATF